MKVSATCRMEYSVPTIMYDIFCTWYYIRVYDTQVRVCPSTNRSKTHTHESRWCNRNACHVYAVVVVSTSYTYLRNDIMTFGSSRRFGAVSIRHIIRDDILSLPKCYYKCRLRWFLICFRLDSQTAPGCTHAHTCAYTPLLHYYPALGL